MKNRRRENCLSETGGLGRLRALARDFTLSFPRLVRLCVCAVAFLAGAAIPAAEAPRGFDVPAGEAADTLKLAARQGGREIAFFAETVRGVRTAALRGSFTPREALARLLDGTGLFVVADETTETLTVSRREPAAHPATPPLTSLSNLTPLMKPTSSLAAMADWLAVALAPAPSYDQTAGGSPSDEALVLSPFQVNSSKDVGDLAKAPSPGAGSAPRSRTSPPRSRS